MPPVKPSHTPNRTPFSRIPVTPSPISIALIDDTSSSPLKENYPPSHHISTLLTDEMSSPLKPSAPSTPSTSIVPSAPSSTALSALQSSALGRTVTDLISFVQQQTVTQYNVNATNQQLHAMNFVMNYANATRNQTLSTQCTQLAEQVSVGHEMISSMRTTIAQQEHELDVLNTQVASLEDVTQSQGATVEVMAANLEQQRTTLQTAMQTYEQRLDEQMQHIRQQEETLERLLTVRFRLDFGVDLVILLAAWYVSKQSLLDYIMRSIIGTLIVSRRNVAELTDQQRLIRGRQLNALVQTFQIILFLFIVRRARQWAEDNGVHNAVGSYTSYATFAWQTTQAALARLLTLNTSKKVKSDTDSNNDVPLLPLFQSASSSPSLSTAPETSDVSSTRSILLTYGNTVASNVGAAVSDVANAAVTSLHSFFSFDNDPNPYKQKKVDPFTVDKSSTQ